MVIKLNIIDRKNNKTTLDVAVGTTIRDAIVEKVTTDNYGLCGGNGICGTCHIQISEADFLFAIETVIYKIESYDTTTVRASVGNYLASKFIRGNSDCKVIFNGDGSDEVCGGYVYMKDAPSPSAFQFECNRLVEEIHCFDVLRSDRSISSNGLEARTPFLDKEFVRYYLSIPPELKMFDGVDRLEKYLLRKAFDDTNF